MSGGPTQVDARLADLECQVRALAARVTALESTSGAAVEPTPLDDTSIAGTPPARPSFDPVLLLSFIGRTLVVIGGAYLLRALTESHVLSPGLGVALGFAFAAVWIVVAVRTAPARWLSATFHGGTAVIIALPLLWEAVMRFAIVGPPSASVVLSAIAMTSLAAAARARLQTLAWIGVVGSIASSIALTAATGAVLPFAIADVLLGVATLWIGYMIDWVWLRWPAAVVADFAVLALAVGVTSHTTAYAPAQIVAAQLLLLGVYVASVAVRTLVRGREVNLFETLQVIAALLVGFGGAIVVARTTGLGGGVLVAVGLVSGAVCYAVAFVFVARRQGLHRNFYFYSSLGLVLVLAGSALGLGDASPLWALLAVAASWAAMRAHRLTLTVHAAVYYVAAAIGSGLLAAAATALAGPPATQSPASMPLLLVFAAGCVCWLMPMTDRDVASDRYARIPRLAIATVVAAAAAAWVVALGESSGTDRGTVATLRTGALALTALALAWVGGGARFREAAWLVYPTLFVGAVKLLAEDLPHSSAATLFVAFAAYGGALIAAPRVMRGRLR